MPRKNPLIGYQNFAIRNHAPSKCFANHTQQQELIFPPNREQNPVLGILRLYKRKVQGSALPKEV